MSFVNVTASRGAACPAAARGNTTTPSAAHNPTADRPLNLPACPLVIISHSPASCPRLPRSTARVRLHPSPPSSAYTAVRKRSGSPHFAS